MDVQLSLGDDRRISNKTGRKLPVLHCNTVPRLNVDLLDPDDPFEIGDQLGHLFSHPYGVDDIYDVWYGEPIFYEAAHPPADWLMVGAIPGNIVLVVPLMKPTKEDEITKCKPIGVYKASHWLDSQYRRDRG